MFLKNEKIKALDMCPTVERHPDGTISVCIEHDAGDYDIERLHPGGDIHRAIRTLVNRFCPKLAEEWIQQQL